MGRRSVAGGGSRLIEAFAGHAAVAVTNAASYSSAVDRAEQLQLAIQSRRLIEQAKGILMAQRRYSGEAAFAELRRASQHGNLKLRDVAAAIVTSVARH